jgi:hypothetical protein
VTTLDIDNINIYHISRVWEVEREREREREREDRKECTCSTIVPQRVAWPHEAIQADAVFSHIPEGLSIKKKNKLKHSTYLSQS